MSETAQPVDLSRLHEVTDGDAELESELIITFLEDTAERLTSLEALLAAGDLAQASRAAHSIKGSSANMGASGLQELAREVETRAKEGDGGAAKAASSKAQAEFGRVRAQLEAQAGS